MQEDDAVRRVQKGDREAFRAIVEAHQAAIRALIACYGIRSADVDDIAQNTFLFSFQNMGEFTPGTSLGAWLKSIARYKALAHLSQARQEEENRKNALRVFLQQRAQALVEGGACAPRAERLRECMGKLDRKHAGLLQKRYSGVPLTDAAREMSLSVDAVKMLLLRIRRGLRRCMELGS